MKSLIIKSIVLICLLLLSHMKLAAQINTDSLRIVNEALQMIKFPDPQFNSPFIPELSAKDISDMGFDQPNTSDVIQFRMRDGIEVHGQHYGLLSNTTVLLLHGTLASSFTYNKMSGLLREALQANVIAIDLRGHGQSGGKPGDISTLNQYAEDLDDLISVFKKDNPTQRVILAGHSMGGGIVLRHAETFPETQVEGYLLFAPNLGITSPTSSQNLNFKSNFIKSHLSRGLGLRMLNELGIHEYDSLKVIFYNLPDQMPIKSYSYRSMQASFPMDYRKALRTIDKPLLVFVGGEDEVFVAKEYAMVIKSYSIGTFGIIEGETHNGIRHSKKAMDKVQDWSNKQLK